MKSCIVFLFMCSFVLSSEEPSSRRSKRYNGYFNHWYGNDLETEFYYPKYTSKMGYWQWLHPSYHNPRIPYYVLPPDYHTKCYRTTSFKCCFEKYNKVKCYYVEKSKPQTAVPPKITTVVTSVPPLTPTSTIISTLTTITTTEPITTLESLTITDTPVSTITTEPTTIITSTSTTVKTATTEPTTTLEPSTPPLTTPELLTSTSTTPRTTTNTEPPPTITTIIPEPLTTEPPMTTTTMDTLPEGSGFGSGSGSGSGDGLITDDEIVVTPGYSKREIGRRQLIVEEEDIDGYDFIFVD